MLEKGIAYRKTGVVNWDPVDQTVLANEQVIDGRGWRTGALVEKREIPMYYLAITIYAEELLSRSREAPGLAGTRQDHAGQLDRRVRGLRDRFSVCAGHEGTDTRGRRAEGVHHACDTLFGVTFMAIAAEHPIAAAAARRIPRCRLSSMSAVAAAPWKPTSRRRRRRACAPDFPCSSLHRPDRRNLGGELRAHGLRRGRRHGRARPRRARLSVRAEEQAAHRQVVKIEDRRLRQSRSALAGRVQRIRRHHRTRVGSTAWNTRRRWTRSAAALEKKAMGRKRTQWRLRDWGISRQRYQGLPRCP